MPKLTAWEKEQGISVESLASWMETHGWAHTGYVCTDFYNTAYSFSKGQNKTTLIVRTSASFKQILQEAIKTVATSEGLTVDELMEKLRELG